MKRDAEFDVPVWNIVYAIGIPLCVIILWAIFLQPGIHNVHVTVLGLAISVILATDLTDIVKNGVGRPRPDLLARCKPKDGTPTHELVTINVCTEKNHHTLHDGFRSFPSGHSSLAFSGLGFFALSVYNLDEQHVDKLRCVIDSLLVKCMSSAHEQTSLAFY